MAKIVVNPEVKLESRIGDRSLSPDELKNLQLFAGLKRAPSFEKYPSATVLRQYQQGETICLQGEAGASAFYILSAQDLLTLKQLQVAELAATPAAGKLAEEIAELTQRVQQSDADAAHKHVATAHLMVDLNRQASAKGPGQTRGTKPKFIPVDGPADVDYESRQAPLYEGEVFGEMSCMTLQPRSATIVAKKPWAILEFQRNIFDQIQRDAGYRARIDEVYRERVLKNHLRQVEILKPLSDDQLETIRTQVDFRVIEPGAIICTEGEPSEAVYIIRSGVVQVVADVKTVISEDAIHDWPGFCAALVSGDSGDDDADSLKDGNGGQVSGLERLKAELALRSEAGLTGMDPLTPEIQAKLDALVPGSSGSSNAPSDAKTSQSEKSPLPDGFEMLPAEAADEKTKEIAKLFTTKYGYSDEAAAQIAEQPRPFLWRKVEKTASAPAGTSGVTMSAAQLRSKSDAIFDLFTKKYGYSPEQARRISEQPQPFLDQQVGHSDAQIQSKTDAILHLFMSKYGYSEALARKIAEQPQVFLRSPEPPDPSDEEETAPAATAATGQGPTTPLAKLKIKLALMLEAGLTGVDPWPPELEAKLVERLGTSEPTRPAVAATPHQRVWKMLPEAARVVARKIAADNAINEHPTKVVVGALNELIKNRDLVAAKEVFPLFQRDENLAPVMTFTGGPKGASKEWTELEVCLGGRLLLETLYSENIHQRERSVSTPRVINYLSRGDVFGEMGVVTQQPRSATCIAYDHPPDDSARKPGRVELVVIDAEVFRGLTASSAAFNRQVDSLVGTRQETSTAVSQGTSSASQMMISAPEFQELGLVQGQQLLLVDLDRCTRCGDCVRACVNTHDDGYSRLFLDGPRFDRFLVPSACRQCLNPACLIDCPVGAIQRGNNGEIQIHDWCIGCQTCERQCPYDSIQMHDTGVLPQQSPFWQVASEDRISAAWYSTNQRRTDWALGISPFQWDLELWELVNGALQYDGTLDATLDKAICFQHEFDVPQRLSEDHYALELVSGAAEVEVALNGVLLEFSQDEKQQRSGEYKTLIPAHQFAAKNHIAVRLVPPLQVGDTALSLRIDRVPQTEGDFEIKMVSEKAIVCDLCSSRAGADPACVEQCPHEAAVRVNARFGVPLA